MELTAGLKKQPISPAALFGPISVGEWGTAYEEGRD
jgi:hypothetical protein